MRPELIVAEKEYRDHLTSKRFIVIFAILLLISAISMIQGMSQYDQMLDKYKENIAENPQQTWYKEQVASLNKQIEDAQANGASAREIASLQYQLDKLVNPDMPSVLFIFSTFNSKYFTIVAMVLSIIMGFDLITREREEGSLKSLLSHPVYRDSVINGKLLAVMGVLITAIGMVFLVMLAIMLLYGDVPSGDDLSRIFAYFLMALLYCGVFFAFAIMASSVTKSSAMSILCVMGLVLALLVLSQSSDDIATLIVGNPPQYTATAAGNGLMQNSSSIPDTQTYYERQQMITDFINTLSPMYNFGDKISSSILSRSGNAVQQGQGSSIYMTIYNSPSAWDSLASTWINILALIVELVIPLGISYITFLRADII